MKTIEEDEREEISSPLPFVTEIGEKFVSLVAAFSYLLLLLCPRVITFCGGLTATTITRLLVVNFPWNKRRQRHRYALWGGEYQRKEPRYRSYDFARGSPWFHLGSINGTCRQRGFRNGDVITVCGDITGTLNWLNFKGDAWIAVRREFDMK